MPRLTNPDPADLQLHELCTVHVTQPDLLSAIVRPSTSRSRRQGMLDYPIPSLLSNPICTNFSFLCIAYQLHKTGMPIPETDGRSDFDSNGGCIPDLVWEQSGRESVPAVAGVVYRIWARRIAGARPGRTVESVSWGGCEGGHKAGPYGNLMGLAGRGLAGHLRLGTCYEYRHQVGEACCWGGRCGGGAPAQGRAE